MHYTEIRCHKYLVFCRLNLHCNNWKMVDELMEIQDISTLLQECVEKDDVVGARRLLAGVDEKVRKLIVAEGDNCDPPLFVAAMRGNAEMVKFLVNECHADMEELGRCMVNESWHLVTPLWCAAALEELDMVELLIKLGANIDAVSGTGDTPVLYACSLMNINVVKCLVKYGADVHKRNDDGETCLIKAVQWSGEICQILIDNSVEMNAQDSSGNTALHWAINSDIYRDKEDIVQLLINRGSNPYMKNKDGDDAFRKASLEGQESILKKLLLKFEPPVKHWIESYELLGAINVNRSPVDIQKAWHYWMKAVEIRRMKSHLDVTSPQTNPFYLFGREVNTFEDLFRNRDFVYMHALRISEQILGRYHPNIQSGLLFRGEMYKRDGEYRRCIDILRYAFQLENDCVEQWTCRYLRLRYITPLYNLCLVFCEVYTVCRLKFEEVFEVLQMVTSKINDTTGTTLLQKFQKDEFLQLIFMKLILHLINLITELDKNEDQQLRFTEVVRRLVHCQPRSQRGQTLLHLSVTESTSEIDDEFFSPFPSIAVVELLLECGANVNAVDDKHNTALHLCSKALRESEINQNSSKSISLLLLKYEAHVDMINTAGDMAAAQVLASNLVEMNILNYVSLKCLAARVIMKYEIPYVGHIPASLESFVQMH